MYLGLFETREDVCREFAIDGFDGTVLFAAYEYEDYSGDAAVIFVHQGKFWLATGSHCSCFGLETQWAPEEMALEALVHIVREGCGVLSSFRVQLEAVLRTVADLIAEDAPPLHIEVMARLAF